MENKRPVNLTDETLKKKASCTPLVGLLEVVWNSIDEFPSEVRVSTTRNPMSGVEKLVVCDNGNGMALKDYDKHFSNLNKSKKHPENNVKNIPYHGKKGEGRFKAYSLGKNPTWTFKSKNQKKFQVIGDFDDITNFEISSNGSHRYNTGCTFSIENVNDAGLGSDETIKNALVSIFAPVLLKRKDLHLYLNDSIIDPKETILNEKDYKLKSVEGNFKIIHWDNKSQKENTNQIHWCSNNFNVKSSENKNFSKNHRISVYIGANYIDELFSEQENPVLNMDSKCNTIKQEVSKEVKLFIKDLENKEDSQIIQEMKSEGLYPYDEAPKDSLAFSEKVVFDTCAISMYKYLEGFPLNSRDSKAFTFKLLKDVIEFSKSDLVVYFQELLKLNDEDKVLLLDLLKRTTLKNIITLANNIKEKADFLEGLKAIVYEKNFKKIVKERKDLQKILESNFWIFGDHYSDCISDQSLLNSAKKLYKSKDDFDEVDSDYFEDPQDVNLNLIPDFILSTSRATLNYENKENLVIEIKRPSVKIGTKEFDQIDNYAQAIIKSGSFDKARTNWKFIVVSSSIKQSKRHKIKENNLVDSNEELNYKTYAYEWAEIIRSAEARIAYSLEKLQLYAEEDKGIESIMGNFPQFKEYLKDSSFVQ